MKYRPDLENIEDVIDRRTDEPMPEDNEYAIISAEIEKVVTRLTNDTRNCICTLRSLTITRDSFALSILGLTLLQERVDKLAEEE